MLTGDIMTNIAHAAQTFMGLAGTNRTTKGIKNLVIL